MLSENPLSIEARLEQSEQICAVVRLAHETLVKRFDSLLDDLEKMASAARQEFIASERTSDEARGRMRGIQEVITYLKKPRKEAN